jgi:hypothetical protein
VSGFPRGWTRSVDVAGGPVSITIAAVAGVAHVLDAISAKIQNQTAGPVGLLVQVTSSGGTLNQVLARMVTGTPAAGSLESDSVAASELSLATGPGESLTVSFSTNANGFLLIQGHDI